MARFVQRPAQLADYRQHASLLRRGRHSLSAGSGGLAADVDDGRPLAGEGQPARDGGVGVVELAAIGEGVGRHVEHAHDPRTIQR